MDPAPAIAPCSPPLPAPITPPRDEAANSAIQQAARDRRNRVPSDSSSEENQAAQEPTRRGKTLRSRPLVPVQTKDPVEGTSTQSRVIQPQQTIRPAEATLPPQELPTAPNHGQLMSDLNLSYTESENDTAGPNDRHKIVIPKHPYRMMRRRWQAI